MGKEHDMKLIGWKKEIENMKCLLLLLQMIEKNQGPENYVELDLAKSTLEKYDGYSEEVFQELILVLNEVGINLERDRVYLKDVVELQTKLKSKKYPTYRLVFNLITLAGLLSPEGNQNLFLYVFNLIKNGRFIYKLFIYKLFIYKLFICSSIFCRLLTALICRRRNIRVNELTNPHIKLYQSLCCGTIDYL